ncbi:MAG TPA: type II 3-dehydroquinate dehydratase [Trebonia sp.]
MIRRVLVLNGPNLGRLGKREPAVYGTATYADLVALCETAGKELGLDAEVRQTDFEGNLIGWVHEAADERLPVVLNAGALTHYSYALMDALKMRTAPLVEVHISNIAAREGFRHESVVTPVADGIIAGFGFQSYVLALRAVASLLGSLQGGAGPAPRAMAAAARRSATGAYGSSRLPAIAAVRSSPPDRGGHEGWPGGRMR